MSEPFQTDAGETTSGHSACNESQNNAVDGEGQLNAAEQFSHWPEFAPWVALGVPLAFELLAVSYEQSQEWGFLGNLWLIFVIAGVGLATTLWLATWLLLSTWPVWGRAVYFVVGLASLAAITSTTVPWWGGDWELSVWLAVVVIGVWLPQHLWWRGGWRICATTSTETVGDERWLRFSISDLLVLTTGIATLFGLVLSRGELDRFTVALLVGQIAAGSLVFWFALSWRNYAAAIGASLLGVLLISMAGFAIDEARRLWDPTAYLVLAYYAGPALTSALVIVAIVRSAGYRLRRDVRLP